MLSARAIEKATRGESADTADMRDRTCDSTRYGEGRTSTIVHMSCSRSTNVGSNVIHEIGVRPTTGVRGTAGLPAPVGGVAETIPSAGEATTAA